MGGSSLQLLLTFVLLLLCMKTTLGNYWGVGDANQGCIERERQALLKIKEDLIDDYGHLSSWSTKNCCKWSWVRCNNQTGHVILLNLDISYFTEEPLRGKLSPSLIDLQYLNYLDVSNNDFNQSQILEFIGSIPKLKYLDLSFSNFGRNIPFQLGNLSSLQYLDLGRNNFNQSPIPKFNHSLSNLRHLGLRSCNFERNIPFQLGNISSLQYLNLSDNHLNEPNNLEWLPQLSSLRFLDMSSVNLSKVNDWLQEVNKLHHLKSLYLDSCNLPNIFPIPIINSSTSLDILDLGNNGFTSSSSVLEWLFNSNTSVVDLELSYNKFQGLIPDGFSKINSLAHLYLDDIEFEGGIPKTFGDMCNLKTLSLSSNNRSGQLLGYIHNLTGCASHSIETLYLYDNQITGSLPDLTMFPSLRVLYLENNHLNGTIPKSLGKQSMLEYLNLADNSLEGIISEAHFSKLTKLNYLDFSNNPSLVFKISTDWVPPFQLESISIQSCQLGPRFPNWLRTQKNYDWLDLSNSRISNTLYNSYWIFSSQVDYLSLSHNQISGRIPNLSLKIPLPSIIDLSSNKLEGEIPPFLFKKAKLDLSKNMFSGPIFSLCAASNRNLSFLDLSNNQLSRQLPNCWMQFERLEILNLASNQFFGKIPRSVGFLYQIETLDLHNNSFNGELPSSLKNCRELKFISLQDNNLSGQIPMWLGSSYPNLVVLILRSNHFSKSMPLHLCHLTSLQLLDLALNHISGSIPKCFNNLTALTHKSSPYSTISHEYPINPSGSTVSSYEDHANWMWKGREYEFGTTLGLIKSIDLSSNILAGMIPREIVELDGLISLNLSRNFLTGRITSEIGALHSLEVLDLSENQLCGGIPSSISGITSLNFLNLSNNNLSGKIPIGRQLDTINASAYEGNPNLCGFPLPKKCWGDETTQNPIINKGRGQVGMQDEEDGFITRGFYASAAFGFVVGFWEFLAHYY